MADFSTPLGWGDVLSVFSGAPGGERIIGELMGTDPSSVQATRTFGGQVNDPMAGQRQEELFRLQDIASGKIQDPSVTGMQQALARGGKQAYGLGQAAPFSSAGARGRMARGGQLAISREAPQLIQAQRLQSQQAAQEMAANRLAQEQAIEQQRLEAIQDDVVDAQVRKERSVLGRQKASSSAIGSTLQSALSLGLFKDGGVVPGHKGEAVPIIAHGGEIVLPEDVSKQLLKALSSKELKGEKKAPQERFLLTDRLQPPPSLDRANVVYAEDVKDQYPGWVENTPGQTWHTGSYDDTPSWLLNQWREQRDAGLPRAGGEQKKWLEAREGGPFRENRLPEFLENNLRGYFPIGRHHVPYESRKAKIEEMKTNALIDLSKRLDKLDGGR